MPPAKLAAAAALLGGALWILYALLGGGDDPVPSALHLLGLGCLLVAAGAFGTTLVRSDALAMRIFVGFASALLALSLVEAFRQPDNAWYDGCWGIAAVLLGGYGLRRTRGGSRRTATGAHAR
ncbi:hypothetical protein [Nocardioides sp. SYSU D00065]|uniref:hypothetical protein n=1 Tax=Nocardioides sp. SYSU D00065 TaxID=2817378 RepID=UPI001B324D76|nr:hypothetical protein [Nocardioides sp. SYSU D00065]